MANNFKERLFPVDPTDPAQRDQVKEFAREVLQENVTNLRVTNQYIHRSYLTLFVMYCTLFGIGAVTAIAAIIRGFMAQNASEAVPALVFAGLSAASFFTLFITRPLESLERNTIFSSWVITVMNTYWTRLMYFKDDAKIDAELREANADLVNNLSALADKYAAAIGKYPALTGPASRSDLSAPGGDKVSATTEDKVPALVAEKLFATGEDKKPETGGDKIPAPVTETPPAPVAETPPAPGGDKPPVPVEEKPLTPGGDKAPVTVTETSPVTGGGRTPATGGGKPPAPGGGRTPATGGGKPPGTK